MNRQGSFAVGVGVAFAAGVLTTTLTRPHDIHAQGAQAQTPRFVMVSPPPQSDGGYPNFIWVLNTQTGEVRGYRFANIKDKNGESLGWVTEAIMNDKELSASRHDQ